MSMKDNQEALTPGISSSIRLMLTCYILAQKVKLNAHLNNYRKYNEILRSKNTAHTEIIFSLSRLKW